MKNAFTIVVLYIVSVAIADYNFKIGMAVSKKLYNYTLNTCYTKHKHDKNVDGIVTCLIKAH